MKDVMAAKQSQVGDVPEGWNKAKVAQIASIITGPFGTLLKASEYGGAEGVPLISVGEVREGFLRVTDETPTVSESVTKRLPQYLLREGDIVFGRKGGVERSAIIKDFQAGWFLGSDGISIRLKDGYHRPFFGHAFRSGTVQSWLLQNASGTTMASLNQAILGAVEIPYPNTPKEQEAIAAALSDADALIEGLERLIAKKRLIKQGAMQDLLTAKRRLPGFSGEWRPITLFEMADSNKKNFDDGDWIEAEHIASSGIRLIQTGNVGVGKFLNANRKYIFPESFAKLRCKEVQPGDVLICRLADPPGRACIVPDIGEEKMLTSVDVTIYRPNEEIADRKLLTEFMSQSEWFSRIDEASGGTTRKRIARSQLGRMALLMPPLKEQKALSELFNGMDAEIQALETRLEKARQVKEGMMQNLLTGRIRLV